MNAETVRHGAIAALGGMFLAATCVQATMDDAPLYVPCFDDARSGKAVLIPDKTKDYPSSTPTDCIFVTAIGQLLVYRLRPEARRVYVVQEFRPEGRFNELPASRWLNEKITVEPLPSPVAPGGIAVGDDGAVVYVPSATPRSVLLFDRDTETGLLRFRELRELGSEAEREEFFRQRHLEWKKAAEQLWKE